MSALWLTFKATSSRQIKEASETKNTCIPAGGLMFVGLVSFSSVLRMLHKRKIGATEAGKTAPVTFFLENIACVNLLACAQSNVGH
jgi:hypothetical protein